MAPTDEPTAEPTLAPTYPPTPEPTLPLLEPLCPCDGTGTATDMVAGDLVVDFGYVDVGSTAEATVTLTNSGTDDFLVHMAGGAPATTEFNAYQNCLTGTPLPAGGSCELTVSFSPGATGTFSDTSSFVLSETDDQSLGETFSVYLIGIGWQP